MNTSRVKSVKMKCLEKIVLYPPMTGTFGAFSRVAYRCTYNMVAVLEEGPGKRMFGRGLETIFADRKSIIPVVILS